MSRHSIRQLNAEVIEQRMLAAETYRLTLSVPDLPDPILPGRFVMLQASSSLAPLLRRAFSVHDVASQVVHILYRVVGQGTSWMSRRRSGDAVNLVGPLGKGFGLESSFRRAVLIAGGMGIAPFQLLIRNLRERGVEVHLFYGAGTARELIPVAELEALGVTVRIATEDGSEGVKGKVTDLFQDSFGTMNPSGAFKIYACGPRPMLFEIARITRSSGIPCEVSLESAMACGLGTCMGCVIDTRSGYRRVCREGPVFDVQDLILEGP
jgi:dihydroorotate dehydrogenase electron transfer subunit